MVAIFFISALELLAANGFAPIDVLDYIDAVLHSPNFRAKYKAFLKIDFPRVLYPKNAVFYWRLSTCPNMA